VADRGVGAFFSGGVDSSANLRVNRATYPIGHPRSVTHCVFVQGFDIGINDEAVLETTLSALSTATLDCGARLIPVRSNLRRLDPSTPFWMREWHGAALASVAHALSKGLGSVSIASTYEAARLPRLWGSHPLLDPLYGSEDVRVYHDGIQYSRLDKLRVVASWDVGLRNLRVCTRRGASGRLNCGRCEKCLRTALELLAIGQLDRSGFDSNDVSVSALKTVAFTSDYQMHAYSETVVPLAEAGMVKLATAIDLKTRRYQAWERRQGWRGLVYRVLGRGPTSRLSVRIRMLDETRDWPRAVRHVFGWLTRSAG
jgi:hypothetical protein